MLVILKGLQGGVENSQEVLGGFFSQIWREEKGYIYLALKNPDSKAWHQRFFEWPLNRDFIIETVLRECAQYEVYFAPAIFKEDGSSSKENVAGSYCFWAEFDGPGHMERLNGLPKPNIIVQSSTPERRHVYWCLEEFVGPTLLEKVNKALAYLLEADISGWDCNQVLRPPGTLNHKRSRRTELITLQDTLYVPTPFTLLPDPAPVGASPVPTDLPPIEEVIRKYSFSDVVWRLFKFGAADRSDGLMSLGYHLAEMKVSISEMMSVLLHADKRWGKFADRSDQLQRLNEIIIKAKSKYPDVASITSSGLTLLGIESHKRLEIKLEWVWEGLLQKNGYLLLTGPSGVGKSQVSLDFATHVALGKDFLGRKITNPTKVGFFSLEMGIAEVNFFLSFQHQQNSIEDAAILEKNFKMLALGEPLYFNREEEKLRIEATIDEYQLQGLIVDSLGSATSTELSSEAEIKGIFDWLDHLRQEKNIFIWFIHHHRKAQSQNKTPNKISDVYGSQYITARATTVLTLWRDPGKNMIRVYPSKVRLSPTPKPFVIERRSNLTFELRSNLLVPEEFEEETPGTSTADITNHPPTFEF